MNPTHVSAIALGMRSRYSHDNLTPIAQIEPDMLGIEVHQRGVIRTVVLEDLDTNVKFPLDVQRPWNS